MRIGAATNAIHSAHLTLQLVRKRPCQSDEHIHNTISQLPSPASNHHLAPDQSASALQWQHRNPFCQLHFDLHTTSPSWNEFSANVFITASGTEEGVQQEARRLPTRPQHRSSVGNMVKAAWALQRTCYFRRADDQHRPANAFSSLQVIISPRV